MNTYSSPTLPAAAQEVVAALVAARRSGQSALVAPLRAALSTDDEAYAVQDAVAQALGWFAEGGPVSYTHLTLPTKA